MTKKEWFSLAILAAVLIFAVYRYHNRLFTETRTKVMMGTLVEVSLTSSQRGINTLIDSTFAVIADYESRLSYYDDNSELWSINNAETDSIAISEDVYNLLVIADRYYQKTSGKYDVTISPLVDLWHQGRTTMPPPDSIAAAKALVGFDRLRFSPDYLIMPSEMSIDFGSIAKGYIIDRAAEYALSQGVSYGHINAGGDIRIFGDASRAQRIGIRHPREPNRIIATLLLSDTAVVTSGDYERYFEVDGVRYHHIINPLTGYPVDGVFSVTVIAPNATAADVISTSLFVMEPEEAIDLVKSIPDAEAIIYYLDDNDIMSLRTEGIRAYLD